MLHMNKMFAPGLIAVFALMIVASTASSAPVVVDTDGLGQITGETTADGKVDYFLGIQYAVVGERFSRSTALLETTTTTTTPQINATAYGPQCYQAAPLESSEEGDLYDTTQQQEEECLYLNIWRPTNSESSSTNNLTTIVFIHGGGYLFGTGADPIYNGANLAREHNVVVVTINYRLGLFGFLVTGDNGQGGLNGIHDQINALTWVQRHIQSFGGNPADVTIFGESAGSMSVCMLSVSPLAKGLFHRSILQSGECAIGSSAPNTAQTGAQVTETLLKMTNTSSVANLADVPAKDLAPYSAAVLGTANWPTVDGWVLPEQPIELYNDPEKIIPVDMMIGSTSYDSVSLLTHSFSPAAFIAAADNMQAEVQELFGVEQGAVIMEAYSPSANNKLYNGNQVAAYAQYEGDYFFRCPSRQFAALVANTTGIAGQVFLFNYAHLSTLDLIVLNGLEAMANINDPTWASHGAEMPLVFDTMDVLASFFPPGYVEEPTAADLALKTEIMNRWIGFAKTGDPNNKNNTGGDFFGEVWTPVPPGKNCAGEATSVPTFVLQSGGGKMSNVDEKAEQCAAFAFSSPPPLIDETTTTTTSTSSSGIMNEVSKIILFVQKLILLVNMLGLHC